MIRIAGLGGFAHRHVAGANHTESQPDEVNGSGVLDHGKAVADAANTAERPKPAARTWIDPPDEGAKSRKHALSLASRESAREDIEDAGAGGEGEQRRSCEEESQQVSVQHLTIVAVSSTGMEIGYETPGLRARYDGNLSFPPAPEERQYCIANFVSTLDGVVSFNLPGQSERAQISNWNKAWLPAFSFPRRRLPGGSLSAQKVQQITSSCVIRR